MASFVYSHSITSHEKEKDSKNRLEKMGQKNVLLSYDGVSIFVSFKDTQQ